MNDSSLYFLAKLKRQNYQIINLVRLLRVKEFGAPRIFRQSAHEVGKVVSPTYRPPLPPQEIFLVLIFVRE